MQSCISRINYLWRNLEVNFHLFHHLPKAINTHKQTLSCWSISWKNVHVTALVVFIYSLYTMYNVHIHCTIMYSFLGSVHINWRCFKSLTNQLCWYCSAQHTEIWTCSKSQSLQIHFLCEIFNVPVHVHILLGIPNDGW